MGHNARKFQQYERKKIHNTLLFNQVHITSGAVATLRNVGESADRLDHCYRGRYFMTWNKIVDARTIVFEWLEWMTLIANKKSTHEEIDCSLSVCSINIYVCMRKKWRERPMWSLIASCRVTIYNTDLSKIFQKTFLEARERTQNNS